MARLHNSLVKVGSYHKIKENKHSITKIEYKEGNVYYGFFGKNFVLSFNESSIRDFANHYTDDDLTIEESIPLFKLNNTSLISLSNYIIPSLNIGSIFTKATFSSTTLDNYNLQLHGEFILK